MSERSSVFDMIGPVMIGPSSSHTAGCTRLARAARLLLNTPPQWASITFYNSFAQTYQGHRSDRAVVGGLLNYKVDDLRIRKALDYAKTQGLHYEFKTVPHALNYHPNTVHFELKGNKNSAVQMLGVSTGGGKICIQAINGFSTYFTAALPSLVIFSYDIKGNIAFIASLMAHEGCNIATMTVARKAKNDNTCLVIEMDSPLPAAALNYLQNCTWIQQAIPLQNLYG